MLTRPLLKPALPYLMLLLLGLSVLAAPTDPDLGWHWRIGEALALGNFPYADNLTFSMAGYEWIHHEWLTDVSLYLIEHSLGWLPLGILFTTLFILAFWISAGITLNPTQIPHPDLKKHQLTLVCITICGVIVSKSVLGIRPQVITLLGFAWLLRLLWQTLQGNKGKRGKLWVLPFFLLAWANLHGGFPIAFILIYAYGIAALFPRLNKNRKSNPVGWEILKYGTIGLLATLVNPYSYRLWLESWSTATDTFAKTHIDEWLPINFLSFMGAAILIYLAFIPFAIWSERRRISLLYLVPLPILLYLGITSVRHWPLVVLYTLPLASGAIKSVRSAISPTWICHFETFWRTWLGRLLRSVIILSVLTLTLAQATSSASASLSAEVLADRAEYPSRVLPYLSASQGNLFNSYGWGGYLAWKLPERQYFIDGRMASWRTEERHILADYDTMENTKGNWQYLLDMYRIKQVLLPPKTPLVEKLKQTSEWKMLYEDQRAVLLERTL